MLKVDPLRKAVKWAQPAYRPLKLALFLSLFVHIIGLPMIFRGCKNDDKTQKPAPKEIIVNIEYEKPKPQPPVPRMQALPLQEVNRNIIASVKPTPRKQVRRFRTKIAMIGNPPKQSGAMIDAPSAAAPTAAESKVGTITVRREGRPKRSGSYVSSELLNGGERGLDRVFKGEGGSSFANNGPLPKSPGSGGCESGNCSPVTFVGRYNGWYHWKDRAGKCYVSESFPDSGECFKARPSICLK